ncbi:unnamed protein product [Amoebophrya sp. A120]|nr:unnamed protein product [Amoebophrya sp. A120]|eukprot:GSA120T00011215001.1
MVAASSGAFSRDPDFELQRHFRSFSTKSLLQQQNSNVDKAKRLAQLQRPHFGPLGAPSTGATPSSSSTRPGPISRNKGSINSSYISSPSQKSFQQERQSSYNRRGPHAASVPHNNSSVAADQSGSFVWLDASSASATSMVRHLDRAVRTTKAAPAGRSSSATGNMILRASTSSSTSPGKRKNGNKNPSNAMSTKRPSYAQLRHGGGGTEAAGTAVGDSSFGDGEFVFRGYNHDDETRSSTQVSPSRNRNPAPQSFSNRKDWNVFRTEASFTRDDLRRVLLEEQEEMERQYTDSESRDRDGAAKGKAHDYHYRNKSQRGNKTRHDDDDQGGQAPAGQQAASWNWNNEGTTTSRSTQMSPSSTVVTPSRSSPMMQPRNYNNRQTPSSHNRNSPPVFYPEPRRRVPPPLPLKKLHKRIDGGSYANIKNKLQEDGNYDPSVVSSSTTTSSLHRATEVDPVAAALVGTAAASPTTTVEATTAAMRTDFAGLRNHVRVALDLLREKEPDTVVRAVQGILENLQTGVARLQYKVLSLHLPPEVAERETLGEFQNEAEDEEMLVSSTPYRTPTHNRSRLQFDTLRRSMRDRSGGAGAPSSLKTQATAWTPDQGTTRGKAGRIMKVVSGSAPPRGPRAKHSQESEDQPSPGGRSTSSSTLHHSESASFFPPSTSAFEQTPQGGGGARTPGPQDYNESTKKRKRAAYQEQLQESMRKTREDVDRILDSFEVTDFEVHMEI